MGSCEREVIVIGGGISGLTAAWRLKMAGVDVCVLESTEVVGGAMRTERREGFLLENGPFNVIVRDPAFEHLLDEFGDEVEVIVADRAVGRARYVLHRRRLCKVPTTPIELLRTSLLTLGGKVRLIRGLAVSRRGIGVDASIHDAATRRFGRQVADGLVSAMCVGIFSGDSRELSLRGCFPTVADVDERTRSPLACALSKRLPSKPRKGKRLRRHRRGLVSFREGLGALPGALARRLGSKILTNCAAEAIRMAGRGYEVQCTLHHGEQINVRSRHLVLAVPKVVASALLCPVAPEIDETLKTISATSLVVLNLGFDRSDINHPLDGYGFLVPRTESSCPLLGVLWADSVFPHHAPPDRRLLRVFMGGSSRPDMLSKSDTELVEIALTELSDLLHLSGDPVLIHVCRWPDAVPQYTIGHVRRVAQIRHDLRQRRRLHLIGNYLEGVSINECVRSAAHAAEQIAQDLGATSIRKCIENEQSHSEAAVARLPAASSPGA